MKTLFERKENEFQYQAVKRFAKDCTKEELANKIIEIITSKVDDWEAVSKIDYLCKCITKDSSSKIDISVSVPSFKPKIKYIKEDFNLKKMFKMIFNKDVEG